MSKKYEDFIKLLKEMFQIEQAKELNFGIYRIMNYRRAEIENFLENELLPQIKQALSEYSNQGNQSLKARLGELEEKAREAGFDSVEELPAANKIRIEYEEIKQKLSRTIDIAAAEVDVYSALLNFFKRYYDKGDFISQRRYKEGVYAIPYEGEEVKLHWANHDQYYIKTTENFRDYTFKITGDKIVHFKLVEAQTEKDYNKEQAGKERRFMLAEENFIAIENGELVLRFKYKVDKDKQDKHIKEAFAKLLKTIVPNSEYNDFVLGIYEKAPTEKNPNRTVLEKHLIDYTAKNTFDYFIHKNLGGFLKGELDFYIKSEIMHLEDLDTENEIQVNQYLGKIKTIKRIGHKIIDFLAQLEDFQKKLWLKKKFVVETNYCITLDRIPEEFYPEIAANDAQKKEWVKLFAIDELEGHSEPLTVEFLKENKNLLLDTKNFLTEFKERLVSSIDNVDEETNGLLIHSENFQALNILHEMYKEKIKCVYIDPPFNAKSSEILYKNNFKHSAWLSLIENRLVISINLLNKEAVYTCAIDEVEQERLGLLFDLYFNEGYEKTCVSIIHNPSGQQGDNFSATHEYAYFLYKVPGRSIAEQYRENQDDWDERNFRDVTGDDSLRKAGPNCFYPIYIKNNQIVGFGDVCDENYHPNINEVYKDDIIAVYPVDPEGIERKWRFARNTVENIKDQLKVHYLTQRNVYDIKRLKKTFNCKTTWVDPKYSANNYGTQLLNHIIPKAPFSYPKSVYTVKDSISAALNNKNNALILDYFAGSGTTAHAIININREEKRNIKYILVEMGNYFITVTKPRIQKVIYSKDWKDGKPVGREGISHVFKYIKLESYEDALNNIELRRTDAQLTLIDTNPALKEPVHDFLYAG